MQLTERALPVRMRRVAVVALRDRVREVLVALAQSGVVDLSGPLGSGEGPALAALRRLETHGSGGVDAAPILAAEAPDVEQLERDGARNLLSGEVEIERRSDAAIQHGDFSVFVGWAPATTIGSLAARLTPLGASVVELRVPPGMQPPTLLAPAPAADPFRPLVNTYGAVPYEDVDPTPFVAVTYCLMFGMMFGDMGDGLLILLGALLLRRARHGRFQGVRKAWPMIAACGASAILFGALYGELFGPTKLVPALWTAPLDSPTRLLAVAVLVGACLLTASYLVGIVNRLREGGVALALTTESGLPGLILLIGGGLFALGLSVRASALQVIGLILAAVGLAALSTGLRSEPGAGGTAVGMVAVGLLDTLLRMFSNVFSFARLAAFGLMHAAIGLVVLHAAGGLTGSVIGDLAAGALFVLGSGIAFALEGIVVAVQALRLEYYELFSRVFARDGRPFRPWSLPLLFGEEAK